jgi:hypothetical protein
LRETVVRARQAHLADLSDVALLKRLKKSKGWLHALCVRLFEEQGLAVIPGGAFQVRAVDATTVKEPGSRDGAPRQPSGRVDTARRPPSGRTATTMRILTLAAAVVALASTATAQERFNYAYGDEVCEAVSFLEDDDYILVGRGRFTSQVNIRDEIDQTFASIGEAIRRGLGIRLSEVDRLNPEDYPYMVSGPGGQRTATEEAETALDIACEKAIGLVSRICG